ncbi:IS3 family transposase [Paractinoplanes tereljensis]|uniref:IS3 family transposase n=1 Tax=Paractinoplanes tereljensis TaxID=571912 RepID=UPI0033962943
MCVWLDVSRSGYYEWRNKPASATSRRREELKTFIVHFFEASDGTYGYRRVHADLAEHGIPCGLELRTRRPGDRDPPCRTDGRTAAATTYRERSERCTDTPSASPSPGPPHRG